MCALTCLGFAWRGDAAPVPPSPGERLVPVIVVDPGHGWSPAERSYTGAYNPWFEVYEDTFNLDIAWRLVLVLRAQGAEVYLTRQGDQEPPDYNEDGELTNADRHFFAIHLQRFHPQASRDRADAYVSIHLNASPDSRKRGTTVVYSSTGPAAPYTQASAQLSWSVHRQLASVLPESAPPFTVSGLYMDKLQLPHSVVEVAFITNRADLGWVQDPANRQVAAERIGQGIMEWWQSYGRWRRPQGWRLSEVSFDVPHVPAFPLPPK